jgi:hypothetical protein
MVGQHPKIAYENHFKARMRTAGDGCEAGEVVVADYVRYGPLGSLF